MKPWALIAGFAALVLLIVANQRDELAALFGLAEPDVVPLDDDPSGAAGEQNQGSSSIESALATLDVTTYLPTMTDATTEDANQAAFLQMIRQAEGTAGVNGYRTMFGGRLFNSFDDHPRDPLQFTDKANRRLWSSAAGAYQFMAVSPIPGGGSTKVDTWDRLAKKLQLADFSPANQDRAALELISEDGALNDVRAGRFDSAVGKVRRTWASMPGAGYAQPERSIEALRTAYLNAGGNLA